MVQVYSLSELKGKIKEIEQAYLLIYKKGSEKSDCAFDNIVSGAKVLKDIEVFFADVNVTRDIHIEYGITSAPTLLEFKNGELINIIKGCNDTGHYKAVFEGTVHVPGVADGETPQKRVVVYSTPTCSWCTTLKNYLKMHNVRYSDIDISKDPKAADELVKRSGQTGVPQTDINGEIIVGFNKDRINTLLNIQG